MKFEWNVYRDNRTVFNKGCDTLCNTVLTFGIPFVGYVDVFLKPTRTFEQGYWFWSGGYGTELTSVLDYCRILGDVATVASIEVSKEEWEQTFDWDGHPDIKTTEELVGLGAKFKTYEYN
jgi:hypothetical protein